MTRGCTWFARAVLCCAVLIGVLAMHALTGPYPAGTGMTAEPMTGVSPMAAAHAPGAAPTDMIPPSFSSADVSMCGHIPCVAILRGHTHSPAPGQPVDVGCLLDAGDAVGAGEVGPLPSQRAPPPGLLLTRLCISRT
jgi:hypothetical protein